MNVTLTANNLNSMEHIAAHRQSLMSGFHEIYVSALFLLKLSFEVR